MDFLSIIGELRETIIRLENRITELERQLKANSQNSSKPPSSDGLKKPNRNETSSLREKGQNKSGGQLNHKGHTLMSVAKPEAIERQTLSVCPDCQTDLSGVEIEKVKKRQVFDIPAPKVKVTEYEIEVKHCPCCQKEVQGIFPEGVNAPAQYGNNIQSMAVYLQHQHFVPEDRLQQIFNDLFNFPIATASLVRFSEPLFKVLEPFTEQVLKVVKEADIKHFDETGFRVSAKTHWLHVGSNNRWTHYYFSPQRKHLLEGVKGTAIHDHWKPYYQLEGVVHGLCNAHHLRELKARIEDGEVWAVKMSRFLKFSLNCKNRYDEHIPLVVQSRLTKVYDSFVKEGIAYHENLAPYKTKPERGKTARRKGHNLVLRLRNFKEDVLRFMIDPKVPFTNNQAEQDIRMMKVKQKISGGFRTEAGANTFIRIRSFLSTLRKQGLPIFSSLSDALQGKLPQFA
jgi:transposase